MPILRVGTGVALALWTLSRAAAGQEHEHGSGSAEHLGTVSFATSCSAAAQPQFDRAVALAPLLRVRAGHPGLRGRRGPRTRPAGSPTGAWRSAPGAIPSRLGRRRRRRSGRARTRSSGPPGRRQDRARARVHRGRRRAVPRPRAPGPADAGARLPRRDGGAGGEPSRRHRGLDLLRARARAGGAADGQDLRRPAEGRRHPRGAVRHAPRPPRPRALHHPQLRRAGARAAGAGRRAALRADRALGAARAAHAVAHVHAPGLLAGVDRHQHRLGGGRQARRRHRRGAARDGLPDVRVPADRPGRGRQAAARRAARDRGALRSGRGRLRGSRRGRRLRAGRDSRALRARARRLGRGREARAAPEPVPVYRGDDLLRARPRRRPPRRPRGRAVRDRRARSRSATG